MKTEEVCTICFTCHVVTHVPACMSLSISNKACCILESKWYNFFPLNWLLTKNTMKVVNDAEQVQSCFTEHSGQWAIITCIFWVGSGFPLILLLARLCAVACEFDLLIVIDSEAWKQVQFFSCNKMLLLYQLHTRSNLEWHWSSHWLVS